VPAPDGVRSFDALFAREENTQFWLYYLFLAVPVLAIVRHVLARRNPAAPREDTAPAMLALAVMSLVLAQLFLRGSLEARFGDMAPPVAVLGAVLMARATAGRAASPGRWALRVAIVLMVLFVTVRSIGALQNVRHELAVAGLSESPGAVVRQAARFVRELGELPAAVRDRPQSGDTLRAAQYLARCTRPTDRVLVATFAPEVLAFADRRFAGGRGTIVPGFYASGEYETVTLARLRGESVPIVLAEASEDYYEEFPQLHEYLRTHYRDVGRVALDGQHELRVLAETGRAARPDPHAELACFG
jgi:hypothetical protein